jgi:hypothetical protein
MKGMEMYITPEIYVPCGVIEGIIGVIGGVLVTVIGFYLKNKRSNKVFLRKKRETSLFRISNLISDDLSIQYKNIPVERLKMYELELTNEGFQFIEDFEITLNIFPKGNATFVEVQPIDSLGKTKVIDISKEGFSFLITREFLNTKKKNGDKVSIQIFADSELEIKLVGGGKGWSVVYKEKIVNPIVRVYNIMFIFFSLFFTFMIFIPESWRNQIGEQPSIYGYIILVVILLVILFINNTWFKKKIEKILY